MATLQVHMKALIAHTMAKASFSVCEYYCSTGLCDLLAYATICKSSCSGLHCDKVADNPHGDAPVVNSVLLFLSK